MRTLRRIAFVAVLVSLLYAGWRFAAGNETIVSVDYVLGRTPEVVLWKALIVSAGAGVALTFLLMIFSVIRARLEARRFRKALVSLESEMQQLRPAPEIEDGSQHGEVDPHGASGAEVMQNA